jgi:hypothetical protein
VEAYYKQLTKLNNVFAFLKAQDPFFKEIFWFGWRKRLKIFMADMPKHYLEEVMESTKQVEDDMTNGRSRIKKKH